MLELKNITKSYNKKPVLKDLSLRLPERGTYAVLGPSGCGKTTLLRLIAGLEKPDGGEIVLPENAKISMVFQEDRLLDALDVRGNVLAVLGEDAESRRLADDCLMRCGLSDAAATFPASLSGGMMRRVAIARAIAYGGGILLMDEPFKGLDSDTKRQVAEFVFENSGDRLTVMVTHDISEAKAYAGKALRFDGFSLTEAAEWF